MAPLEIAPDVWMVRLPLGGRGPLDTLTYLLSDSEGGVHVVDPGVDTEANLGLLLEALRAMGRHSGDLRSITSTHLHRDHTQLGLRLRDLFGTPLAIHEREQETLDSWRAAPPGVDTARWGVPDGEFPELDAFTGGERRSAWDADLLLREGDVLGVPGFELRVIHTPGHTNGSIVLWEPRRDVAFTGDHVLPHMFPGIGVSVEADDPFRDYFRSLDALTALGDPLALPGHGDPFRGLQKRVTETREHQSRRTDEVASILATDPGASVWDVASHIRWTAGWDALVPFERFSALRQTAMRMRMLRD